MSVAIDPERFLADLRELRCIGELETGVQRLAFGPEDRRAREWLLGRLRDAGLEAEIDGIGSVHGRWPGATRVVLTGSHTDTVPRGGWLDGALGVVGALEAARALREAGVPGDVGVDVVSFADEEGTFLGTLGSTVLCGEVDEADLARARNADGTALPDALREAGYAGREVLRLDPARHAAFVELHIEQGPRLEAAGVPVGVVTGIVGMRRIAVSFGGRADHAGTTPMDMREDAGAAAIRFAGRALDTLERSGAADTVWNVGRLTLEPGAGNVVPSRAEVLVEYRDVSDDVLGRLDAALHEVAAEIAQRHGLPHEIRPVVHMSGCDMSAPVVEAIEASAADAGAASLRLASGAGHDAMILRRHVSTGMLFVPSIGGRSHDVAEDTSEEHLVTGARVLAGTIERLLGDALAMGG